MALVVPPPASIPNALNPTTAAVQRDAEKREITPAINPDSASASADNATADKDKIDYKSARDKTAKKKDKKKAEPKNKSNNTAKDSENLIDDVTVISDEVNEQADVEFSFAVGATPEAIIAQVLALKQHLLEKTSLTDADRWQLSEINRVTRKALTDLARLKRLDEVKAVAAELPLVNTVLKGDVVIGVSLPVALDDLFAFSFADDSELAKVSAKSKLAGAVVGQFYEDNIEPQIPPKIDHQE
ncbi:MAG: hypothetical protein ACI86X_000272 [Moritella sp.]|jgi:hypothetical protein